MDCVDLFRYFHSVFITPSTPSSFIIHIVKEMSFFFKYGTVKGIIPNMYLSVKHSLATKGFRMLSTCLTAKGSGEEKKTLP